MDAMDELDAIKVNTSQLRLVQTCPAGWVAGWLGGSLEDTDNQAISAESWALAELGNMDFFPI